MKQKLLLLCMALLTVITASAYDFAAENDDGVTIYYYKNSDGNSVYVTYKDYNYNSYSGTVNIPATVTYRGTTYSVTSIGYKAFYGCSRLTSVTIPNSVTSIGENAFSNTALYNDKSNWVNNVLYIGNHLIVAKSGLSGAYTIKEGAIIIANNAFSGCSGLTSVTIPNSVTSIGKSAFYGCSGLTSVDIPSSVTSIGYAAFCNCSGLTSVTIGNSVTSIGDWAFGKCTGLTSVTIGNSVTSIGENAFYNTALYNDDSNWVNNVLYIGNHLIVAKSGLSGAYTIKEGTITIANNAFYGCTGLTSVTIPNSVTSISGSAFEGCSGLTSVTIPNSVTSIGGSAFYNCSGLTSVTIPNSVTSIGNSAFERCSGLTSVTIGNSVTSISREAFSKCSGLKTLRIEDGKTELSLYSSDDYYYPFKSCAIENLYVGRNLSSWEALCNTSSLKQVVIGNNVTSIGSSAFYGCSGLTSVTIPNSVTSIDQSAFRSCSGLKTLRIEDGETELSLYSFDGSYYPFKSCAIENLYVGRNLSPWRVLCNTSSLKQVEIGNSVTSIGWNAFESCSGLTSVTIPNSVTSISGSAFEGCSGLIKSAYPSGLSNPFSNGIAISYPRDNNIIENGEVYSADKSKIYFIPLDANGEFTIPETVITIGEYAFSGCTGLTQVNAVSETAPNDFENSFESLYSTATLNIPAGALQSYLSTDYWYLFENIKAGDTAFSRTNDDVFSYITNPQTKEATLTAINDKTMTAVTIPSRVVVEDGDDATFYQVTIIGQSAFKGMTSLTSIKLPANLTAIYDNAFNGCTGLTAITFPSKVSLIGNSAFQGCTGFTSIEFPETLATLGNSAFQDCSKLASVAFPESLTTLGNSAFQGCSNLASVAFPENTISIGDKAFYSCPALANINAINATTIGTSAFESSKVAEVNITAETIGENCFKWCSSLTSATINCPMITNGAFYGCSKLAAFDFATVKTIGGEAFRNSGLTEAVIARSVESIGNNAFQNCSKLNTFVIQDGTEAIDLDNSIVSDSPIANLYVGRNYEGTAFASNGMKSLVIGNAVTELPEGAFQSSTSLKKVEIGSMLEAIPANAFKGCTSLADIVVPPAVKSIGANAFDGCKAIGNISIGCGTTEIGELAFNEVNAAKTVCVAAVNPPSANNNSFSNYNVPLYVPEDSKDTYYNYPQCWYRFEPEALKVITEVTIDGFGSIVNMKEGETIKLTATIEPSDATMPYIFWRSTNPNIVTVDNEGNVTFLKQSDSSANLSRRIGELECQIIGETMYADAPVAVIKVSNAPDSDIEAEAITINKSSLSLNVGDSETLTATVSPENTTDKTVTWTSSNDEVATVDADGKVTAVAVGKATITATCGSVSATCAVTVNPIVATSVTLNKTSLSLKEGGFETLIATVTPDNTTDKTITWTSSNASIATVDGAGKVTAIAIGTATVTATCGSVSASCQVTVASNVVAATSVTLNKSSLELEIGSFETLVATVAPENTTDKTITWTSSNAQVATVDVNGKVTAIAVGTATITAICGNVSASCEITVKPIVASGVTLNKSSLELEIGSFETLVATVAPENTTDKTITWTSSNDEVATVDADGKVTAVGEGKATITASCGNVSASCEVTVASKPSGIEDAAEGAFAVRAEGGAIIVEGLADDMQVRVFTNDGRLVYSGYERRIPLQGATAYIVVSPKGTKKIAF